MRIGKCLIDANVWRKIATEGFQSIETGEWKALPD